MMRLMMLNDVESLLKRKGFSLIEILVSLAIISLGLLALASFQGELFHASNQSKARAEAAMVAATKLESFRAQYFDESSTNYNPNDWYDVFTASDSVVGTNANFTVSYSISGIVETTNSDGDIVYINQSVITAGDKVKELILNVSVNWDGASLPYVLQSRLSYIEDSELTAILSNLIESGIVSPTGKARLGEGKLNEYELAEKGFSDPDGDGVQSYKRDVVDENGEGTPEANFGDVVLINSLGEILLTLDRACVTQSGNCTDFSVIKGRFFIDKSQFPNAGSAFEVKDGGDTYVGIYLKASDAAYCSLYYGDVAEGPHFNDKTFIDNDSAVLSSASETAMADPYITDNSDYQYLSYSCYVGAGWYGNIGVLLKRGLTTDDKLAMGDPTSLILAEQPQLALKRVYRGMVVGEDNSCTSCASYSVWDLSSASYTTISAESASPVYQSIGIRDAVVLDGQDMVFCSEKTAGDCDAAMTRPDSLSGASPIVFEGMPTDFVCLNSVDYATNVSDATAVNVALDLTASVLNNNYYALADCPFNPSDPPSSKHQLTLNIPLTGLSVNSSTSAASTTYIADVYTSDGGDLCKFSSYQNDLMRYICDFYTYDVDGDGVDENWIGYAAIIPQEGVACDSLQTETLTLNTSYAREDFDCSGGTTITLNGVFNFLGTLKSNGSRNAPKYSIPENGMTIGGQLAACSFKDTNGDDSNTASNGYSFSCIVDQGDINSGNDKFDGSIIMQFESSPASAAVDAANHVCSSSIIVSNKSGAGSAVLEISNSNITDTNVAIDLSVSDGSWSGEITVLIDPSNESGSCTSTSP